MMVALSEQHFFFQQLERHCSVVVKSKVCVLMVTVALGPSKIPGISAALHLISAY